MSDQEDDKPRLFDKFAVPIMFVLMFVAPDYIGDVSLEGLDTYILAAPIGSTREEVDAGLRHFKHCYYRSPGRTVTPEAADYVYRGTTSDVGFLVSVSVHCPFGPDGRLVRQCTRAEWALIPADVEGYERRSNSYINQADEWSNAGQPECPVRD